MFFPHNPTKSHRGYRKRKLNVSDRISINEDNNFNKIIYFNTTNFNLGN